MAKSKGFFGTIGSLFRWLIIGLAALFAVALYINFTAEPPADTGEGELVVEIPAEDATVRETLEGGETEEVVSDAVETELEESADTELDAGDDGIAEESATAEEQAEAEPAAGGGSEASGDTTAETDAEVAETTETADAGTAATDATTDMAETPLSEDASVPTLDTTSAAEGAIPETGAADLAPDLGTVTVPGDDATYELLSAFRRDDGLIEMVTRKTYEGVNLDVTRLVRCAPLEVGLIAEGDGSRIDTPDMEPIVLGNAVATLAAMACGAMK